MAVCCRRRWRWWPTSTRRAAAGCRWASWARSRSSATCSGPLYGAVVLAFGTWRDIFWINLAAGLVLAAVVRSASVSRGTADAAPSTTGRLAGRWRWPPRIAGRGAPRDGAATSRSWRTSTLGCAVRARSPGTSPVAVPAGDRDPGPGRPARGPLPHGARPAAGPAGVAHDAAPASTSLGAALLAAAWPGVILAFATADPEVQVFSPAGPWLLRRQRPGGRRPSGTATGRVPTLWSRRDDGGDARPGARWW